VTLPDIEEAINKRLSQRLLINWVAVVGCRKQCYLLHTYWMTFHKGLGFRNWKSPARIRGRGEAGVTGLKPLGYLETITPNRPIACCGVTHPTVVVILIDRFPENRPQFVVYLLILLGPGTPA